MSSRDALIVGINNYEDDNLPNLNAPAEDAEALAKLLKEYGDFKIWRLPEGINSDTGSAYVSKKTKVTLTQLKKALVQLFKPEGSTQFTDTALFYFSGHGIRDTIGLQECFLATSDVEPEKEFNGLSLRWLRELLRESPVKQQLVWLDCCHSGKLLNLSQADPREEGQARDRCFIAASREFESAYEDISEPHSVLTKELLKGLNPRKYPQRWITNYRLVNLLSEQFKDVPQRPIFNNLGQPINLIQNWKVEPRQEEVIQFDNEVVIENNQDYIKLEDLLKVKSWKKADEQTAKIMLKVAHRKSEGWLDIEQLERFPSEDLQKINKLWFDYSHGHFGFSVQKEIWHSMKKKYETLEQIYSNFGQKVGWYMNKQWLGVEDIKFSMNAPKGHLPILKQDFIKGLVFPKIESISFEAIANWIDILGRQALKAALDVSPSSVKRNSIILAHKHWDILFSRQDL